MAQNFGQTPDMWGYPRFLESRTARLSSPKSCSGAGWIP